MAPGNPTHIQHPILATEHKEIFFPAQHSYINTREDFDWPFMEHVLIQEPIIMTEG